MFTDTQLERYADVLMWALGAARKSRFKKGDLILIRFHAAALPLAERLFSRVIEAGMHPVPRLLSTPRMESAFYKKADARQLVFHPPGTKELFESLNGSIFLYAPEALTHLGDVDPLRIAKSARAYQPFKEILDTRDKAGAFGWTLCLVPTEEPARHAGIDTAAYTRQIVKACFLDRKNPVAMWREVHREVQEVKKWLTGLAPERLHIASANVDLVIRVGEKRRWLGISGHNIPSFEVFVSPDWHGTEGRYFADLPSYRSGNRVEKVRINFQKGRAVEISAEAGEPFVKQQLAMDTGACRVGEFSLTDKRFSRIDRFMANTLFDENFGGSHGNCHIALGDAYTDAFDGDPESLDEKEKKRLGFNQSALHWDLVNTEKKQVTARLKGGREIVIYENGRFAV